MKKKMCATALTAMAILMAATGCTAGAFSTDSEITVISREDGSGTRGAFVELFGVEEKDADGKKIDRTIATADVQTSTGVVLTSVAGNKNAIGYVSMGAINDTVKALKIDGAAATTANVKSGDYRISRPFNIATGATVSEVTQDFITYIRSLDGQKIVEDAGYIASVEQAAAYNGTKPAGTVKVSGSSSVTPVMEKLAEAYKKTNTNATVEINMSDSTTGMKDAASGTADIGMASRALKDSELAGGLTGIVIAMDGIAVIVNTENTLSDLSAADIKAIYTGTATKWSDVQ